MLRSLFGSLCHKAGSSSRVSPAIRPAAAQLLQHPSLAVLAPGGFLGGVQQQQQKYFAAQPQLTPPVYQRYRPEPVALEDMPFLHHGKRPRYTNYKKFIMPRKRAYKMMEEITHEAVNKAKAARPAVYESGFQVGDAIEVWQLQEGSLESKKTETIRGVVMGIYGKRLDTWILIRDIIGGEPVETSIPLHSPLLKSIKVLERQFITRGKYRWSDRAKLYYLRDRNASFSNVSKIYGGKKK